MRFIEMFDEVGAADLSGDTVSFAMLSIHGKDMEAGNVSMRLRQTA